jgi:hypothetical protein
VSGCVNRNVSSAVFPERHEAHMSKRFKAIDPTHGEGITIL